MFDRLIAFRARQAPHAVAVSMPSGDASYLQLERAIAAVATALSVDAFPDGPHPTLVALRLADPYVDWLVLLGLARLGIATASIAAVEEATILPVLRPDLVIADRPADERRSAGDAAWFHASTSWLKAALRRVEAPAPPHPDIDPDSLARICTSSGTTGQPKLIPLSWRSVQARVWDMGIRTGSGGSLARFLPLIDAGAAAFVQGLCIWATGGTVLMAPREINALAAALPRLHPSGTMMSPAQLQLLLKALPVGFLPLPNLTVWVAGSHMPTKMRREARLRLSPNLFILYGSTEAGAVAQGHAAALGDDSGSCGWILPSIEAQVVDEAGRPLPSGASGLLRVRGSGVAYGYLDDPEADARHFGDGWFTAGDLATLGPDGLLRIEGRADERMNFGGVKTMPLKMEEAALSCPGVRDAGAFSLADATGLPQPWIAVVRDDGLDPAALDHALRTRLTGLPPIRIAWIEAIPRNPNGKIERDRLRAAAATLPAAR